MCLSQGDIERPSSLATDKICFSTEKNWKKTLVGIITSLE